MRKKILIIAAVAGFDLAFIFLMGGGLELSEITRVEESTTAATQPYLVLKPVSDELAEPAMPVDETAVVARAPARAVDRPRFETIAQTRGPGKEKSYRRTGLRPAASERKAGFTDTIIWVNTPVAIRSAPTDSYQLMQADAANNVDSRDETKKRSFVSRAAPIVKKPYEWIKALAAKLK